MAEVSFEGMEELVTRLQQLGSKAYAIENNTIKAGAQIIQKAASEKAPRSTLVKEHLADHIVMSKVKTQGGVKFIEVGPQRSDNHKFFYGKFLEFGTSKMSPRPFMGPACEEQKTAVMETMKAAIKVGLGL